MNYSQKLKDPRWQKKRLEVMERDKFTCRTCGETKETLTVHHINYRKGADPWEYDSDNLRCLCESCHDVIELTIIPWMRDLAVELHPTSMVEVLSHIQSAIQTLESKEEIPIRSGPLLSEASKNAKVSWIIGYLYSTGNLANGIERAKADLIAQDIKDML